MFKNYITTAIRNLKRNKTYTFINVFGLALGISAALILFKIVIFEKSFDKSQSNYDDIYRFTKEEVNANVSDISSGIQNPFAAAFKNDFPDYGTVIRTFYQGTGQLSVESSNGNFNHFEISDGIAFADADIFQVFDFEILIGDPEKVLSNPKSAIISESFAYKLFGAEKGDYDQVIGKTIRMDTKMDVEVTGVFMDPPLNTSLPFKMLVEYEALDGFFDFFQKDGWGSSTSAAHVYLLKNKGISAEQIEAQLPAFEDKYMGEESQVNNFSLQALKDVHFQPEFDNYESRVMDREVLMIPVIVGIFLILTACVNFVNLATAQAVKRSKEVGIRKVLGGEQKQLALQFLGETFFLTAISVLISLGAAELAMTNLQELIGYELSLNLLNDPQLLGLIGLITIVVTFLAGTYPSMILSSLKPVNALKSKGQSAMSGKANLRRGLVIFQFSISQILVICTLVVVTQMDFFTNKDLGFRKNSIITFELPSNEAQKLSLIRNELMQKAKVANVSFAFSSPTSPNNIGSTFNYAPLKSENSFDVGFKVIDENYLSLYDIELLAGRNLAKTDTTLSKVLVSEKILKIMNIESPDDAIGISIETGFNGAKTIVGVFKDFHSSSLKNEMQPLIMISYRGYFYEGAVHFEGDERQTKEIIAAIEKVWTQEFPDNLFDTSIYSEMLLEDYEDEASMLNLFQVFSGIAILIGCLGLYGLIAFMANQKTKEIGVRKVLGASVPQILNIFSKELIVLIIISFLIAAPVGYYVMEGWLSDFSYRININIWVFVIAVAFTIIVGGATTGYRSMKAARANPVDSLRAE
jgi:putative ABC transport system permease protein